MINVRPVGVLNMTDDGGGDEKIIAVPSPKLTQRYVNVKNYTDLPRLRWSRFNTSSNITKTWNPGNG